MITTARTLCFLTLLASLLALPACGEQDSASTAVGWLERSFRTGDIKDSLSTGERVAFSRIDGLRRRGAHVVEGMGIQYRFVRVEAITPTTADLQEDDGAGNTRKLVTESNFKRVADGEITKVAEITAEMIPDREWLQANAWDLIEGGVPRGLTRRFLLVHDGEGWLLAGGAAAGAGNNLLRAYRDTDSLKSKVIQRELAKRLVTHAPLPAED